MEEWGKRNEMRQKIGFMNANGEEVSGTNGGGWRGWWSGKMAEGGEGGVVRKWRRVERVEEWGKRNEMRSLASRARTPWLSRS